jgi:hypothetical protein
MNMAIQDLVIVADANARDHAELLDALGDLVNLCFGMRARVASARLQVLSIAILNRQHDPAHVLQPPVQLAAAWKLARERLLPTSGSRFFSR